MFSPDFLLMLLELSTYFTFFVALAFEDTSVFGTPEATFSTYNITVIKGGRNV